MFERVLEGMHRDPIWIPELSRLGCFVKDDDIIRKVDGPDDQLAMHITNNARYNDLYMNAISLAIRRIIRIRAHPLGVRLLYLIPPPVQELIQQLNLDASNPSSAGAADISALAIRQQTISMTKPAVGAHAKIYVTASKVLKTRKKVVLLINECEQPLGIVSSRCTTGQNTGMGINIGSIINLARLLVTRSGAELPPSTATSPSQMHHSNEALFPGLIALSPTPLYYSPTAHTIHTSSTWDCLRRPSTLHPEAPVHPYYNIVPGHQSPHEHFVTVFESIITNPDYCRSDVELYVIANGSGADNFNTWLRDEGGFEKYGHLIAALALINPAIGVGYADASVSKCEDPKLGAFFAQKARAWSKGFSGEGIDEVISIPDPELISSPSAAFDRWVSPDEKEVEKEQEGENGDPDQQLETASKGESNTNIKPYHLPLDFHHKDCPCHIGTPNFSWLEDELSSDRHSSTSISKDAISQQPTDQTTAPIVSFQKTATYSLFPVLSGAPVSKVSSTELLLPPLIPHILSWFELVSSIGPKRYQNPHFNPPPQEEDWFLPPAEESEEIILNREKNVERMEKAMESGFKVVHEWNPDEQSGEQLQGIELADDSANQSTGAITWASSTVISDQAPASSIVSDINYDGEISNPLGLNVGDRRHMSSRIPTVVASDQLADSSTSTEVTPADAAPVDSYDTVVIGGVEIPRALADLADL